MSEVQARVVLFALLTFAGLGFVVSCVQAFRARRMWLCRLIFNRRLAAAQKRQETLGAMAMRFCVERSSGHVCRICSLHFNYLGIRRGWREEAVIWFPLGGRTLVVSADVLRIALDEEVEEFRRRTQPE
jgi:hypothetical protein